MITLLVGAAALLAGIATGYTTGRWTGRRAERRATSSALRNVLGEQPNLYAWFQPDVATTLIHLAELGRQIIPPTVSALGAASRRSEDTR